MNPRKLALPLLVALACIGAGATVLPAAAATRQPAPRHRAKAKKLRVDSIRVGTKAGPLVLRVAADVQTEVGMTVNGKRVRTPFELAGSKAQVIELRSADGLHAGPNKLQIRATRAGVVSKATRTVKVPGWALLAEAGEDVGSYAHIHAGVGAPPAPGANAAGSVDYRWSIADAPKGADATVTDAGDPEAELRTQDPGTYVLQEEANPEADGVPTSFEQVTVSVAPKDPPIGAPINTLDAKGAIVIAGQSYGGTTTGSSFVVLERTTRNVVESGIVNNDIVGMNKLNEVANRYGAGGNYMRYLMIVSGSKGVPAELDAFAALLKKLGVALPSQETFQSVKANLPFSVIGIPGAPAGAATTRFPGNYNPPVPAAITGYLQTNQAVDADGTPLYEYVSGDQPEFSTKTPDSTATTDNMVVGGQTYSGSLPAGATAGLHVVVLESLTLRQISNQVLVTNGTGNARTLQAQAAKELASAIEKPGGPLVLVQSIGKPSAAGPEWQGIVNPLVRLGANPELVNALNGSTEYALVSRLGSKAPPAEASTAYDKGPYEAPNLPPASLIGTLARSRTSNYVPNLSGTPTANDPEGGMNLALDKIAYQPTQAWPALPGGSAADTAKAEHLICERMKFCLGANSCPTLRECFWQRYGEDWNEKLTLLQAVNYPGASSGFSAGDLRSRQGRALRRDGRCRARQELPGPAAGTVRKIRPQLLHRPAGHQQEHLRLGPAAAAGQLDLLRARAGRQDRRARWGDPAARPLRRRRPLGGLRPRLLPLRQRRPADPRRRDHGALLGARRRTREPDRDGPEDQPRPRDDDRQRLRQADRVRPSHQHRLGASGRYQAGCRRLSHLGQTVVLGSADPDRLPVPDPRQQRHQRDHPQLRQPRLALPQPARHVPDERDGRLRHQRQTDQRHLLLHQGDRRRRLTAELDRRRNVPPPQRPESRPRDREAEVLLPPRLRRHDLPRDREHLLLRHEMVPAGQVSSADLLDGPAVAIGVGEEDEAAPGEVLDVADLDAAGEELLAGPVDVADDQLQALERARRHLVGAAGQRDRAVGTGRGELDEAEVLGYLVVVFGDEARLLDVEGLGAVDVGDGDLDQLQAPVDLRGALGGSTWRG